MPLRAEFDTPLFKKGLTVRREVLGAEYVDKSVQEVADFMVPMQKMTTEWCWGEIWTRPALDRKTRSIMNLCMLSALNRPNEIRLHVLGALNNGVTPEEMQEVFLQVCIYCGVPAALDSFKIAKEVIDKYEQDKQQSSTERQ